MKAILNELSKNDNIILFIDEIHTIVGAGGATGSLMQQICLNLLWHVVKFNVSVQLLLMNTVSILKKTAHLKEDFRK